MDLNAFISKVQQFSSKLEYFYYLNQEERQKLDCSLCLEEQYNNNDHDIIIYEQSRYKQQYSSFLTQNDRFKRQQEIKDVSNMFQEWKSNYLSKFPKMFRRQKQEQFMELNAVKEAVIQQFGEVGEQFLWMRKEEQIANQSIISSRVQNKEYFLKNVQTRDNVQFTLVQEDYKRLMPGKDLNDALIDGYLKIVKTFILPQEINRTSYIFSTYLLHKLTSEIEQQAITGQIDIFADHLGQAARQQVKKNYDKVQRWNRKIDIFDKKILVFPINMHVHWFCVIVLNPNSLIQQEMKRQDVCTIIFCDSMFIQRFFVVEAIREYLSLQLHLKRNINIQVTEKNAPSFQLLLPRQTNKHDCGLYMLTYIEELLLNNELHFNNLYDTTKRNKLRYFPRRYMYSLRQRIMTLLIQLYQKQSCPAKTIKVLQKYIKQKQKIYEEAQKTQDFDFIDEKELLKFQNLMQVQRCDPGNKEQNYRCLIKFSLISEVNYLEKDSLSEQEQLQSDGHTEYF